MVVAELALWSTRFFPHLISGLHHPRTVPVCPTTSWFHVKTSRISRYRLQISKPGSRTAHTYNLQWPTGFNLEVVLNAKPANPPDLAARLTTPIDYTYYTEVEEEITPDERAPPCRQLRSGTPPNSASGQWASPPRASRSRSPLPRREYGNYQHHQVDRPRLPSPTVRRRRRCGGHGQGARCRNVGPEQPRPKTECPTKGAPQRTPPKGQGKAHRGGKGKGKGSSNAASSGNQPVPLPHAYKLAPRPFPHTFGYVCLLLSNDECWMQIVWSMWWKGCAFQDGVAESRTAEIWVAESSWDWHAQSSVAEQTLADSSLAATKVKLRLA